MISRWLRVLIKAVVHVLVDDLIPIRLDLAFGDILKSFLTAMQIFKMALPPERKTNTHADMMYYFMGGWILGVDDDVDGEG